MDGATAALGPFLICTTGKDVIRNLTKNIKSYLKDGGSRREVIVSTSQCLNKKRRTNLEKRAMELGFYLKHIYDRTALAELLYYEPRWSKELLGLSGRPSALTIIPLSERPLLDNPLIGREGALAELQGISSDRLIVGSPGSGKTYLLRSLALKGGALFLVDSDKTAIAEAVRSQQPKAIIVDDAHFHIELLIALRQLRSEIGADFAIIAVSWEGDKDRVAEALSLTSSQVIHLDLLTRDEMVSVIKDVGIAGPDELIREIVDQAEGRPGLAVTLSYLCLHGDVRKVVLGDSLSQTLGSTFQTLVGNEAKELLAAFALGGNTGMRMDTVSSFLGIRLVDLHVYLSRLAAGGVIRESGSDQLSVWPRTLRYALVRDVFFNGICKLPSLTLMQHAPDRSEMVETLVESARRGAVIPQLRSVVESANSVSAWHAYASLGESEARYVLEHQADLLPHVGRTTLRLCPRIALPVLLDRATGDERDLRNATDHPLRWVEDWIHTGEPGTPTALRRRKMLVDSVQRWLERGGDERVGLRALCLAVIPAFESHSTDPGSGMTFTIRTSLLTADELAELGALWNRIIDIIRSFDEPSWLAITQAVRAWAYPEVGRVKHIPDDSWRVMESVLKDVLEKLAAMSRELPGVQQWVREESDRLGFSIETNCDTDFEALFPTEDFHNWEEFVARQQACMLRVADEWLKLMPHEVATRITRLETEAGVVGKDHPRWTPLLAEHIANSVDPLAWINVFLRAGLAPDTVWPFLYKLIKARAAGWEDVLLRCLQKERYNFIAVISLLTISDLPSDFIDKLLDNVGKYPDRVKVCCMRREVPEETLALLLRHQDRAVSTAAAVGEWLADPQGQVRSTLASDWRSAIVRAEVNDYWVGEILKRDSSLAYEWLSESLNREEGFFIFDPFRKDKRSIVEGLNVEQRLSLLDGLQNKIGFYDLVEELVGDNTFLYRELVKRGSLADYHLNPLRGKITEAWTEKALIALEAGYEPEQIAEAAFGESFFWSGDASTLWRTWVDEFESLNKHDEPRLRSIADAGLRLARERAHSSVAYERKQAVYGRHY
jgi:hypothetical protein